MSLSGHFMCVVGIILHLLSATEMLNCVLKTLDHCEAAAVSADNSTSMERAETAAKSPLAIKYRIDMCESYGHRWFHPHLPHWAHRHKARGGCALKSFCDCLVTFHVFGIILCLLLFCHVSFCWSLYIKFRFCFVSFWSFCISVCFFYCLWDFWDHFESVSYILTITWHGGSCPGDPWPLRPLDLCPVDPFSNPPMGSRVVDGNYLC